MLQASAAESASPAAVAADSAPSPHPAGARSTPSSSAKGPTLKLLLPARAPPKTHHRRARPDAIVGSPFEFLAGRDRALQAGLQ
jgi:hypothetical protein